MKGLIGISIIKSTGVNRGISPGRRLAVYPDKALFSKFQLEDNSGPLTEWAIDRRMRAEPPPAASRRSTRGLTARVHIPQPRPPNACNNINTTTNAICLQHYTWCNGGRSGHVIAKIERLSVNRVNRLSVSLWCYVFFFINYCTDRLFHASVRYEIGVIVSTKVMLAHVIH